VNMRDAYIASKISSRSGRKTDIGLLIVRQSRQLLWHHRDASSPNSH
jgi:hypothetical protein